MLSIAKKKCLYYIMGMCGSNSMARVPAFQAGCCEFESRLPLHKKSSIFLMTFYFTIRNIKNSIIE